MVEDNKGIIIGMSSKSIAVILKRMGPKTFAKIAARVNLRVQAKAIISVMKGLAKNPAVLKILESKIAIAVGKRVGTKTATAAATKAATKVVGKVMGSAVAKTLVSASAKMATKIGTLASTGPIGAAILLAQVIPMLLDIADAGGYGAMQTKSVYLKFKEKSDNEFKQGLIDSMQAVYEDNPDLGTFNPADIEWPQIFDPTSAKTDDDLQLAITKILNKILDPDTSPIDPIAKNYFEALNADLASGKVTEADLDDDSIADKYMNLIDIESISTQIKNTWCSEVGGIVLEGGRCTLPESKCNSQYTLPLKEEDTYTEFKDGKCWIADPAMRNMCAENKLPYNPKTGICDITEQYCKSKGAEYVFNKKINDYDCKVPVAQAVFETMFGTTLIRGLKQIFDADQYESCGTNNEIKVSSGKCVDVPAGNTNNGTRLQVYDCNGSNPQKFFVNPRDSSIRTSVNYNKCFEVNDTGYIQLSDCRRDRYRGGGVEGVDWKYTTFGNDPDCLNNWDYYDRDGTTLIKGNIANVTTERDTKSWCAINNSSTGRQKFDYNSSLKRIFLKKDRKQVFDLDGNADSNGTPIKLKEQGADTATQSFHMPNSTTVSAGLTCDIMKGYGSRFADCPNGMTNNGANCGRSDKHASSDLGKGKFEAATCPDGYKNWGATCFRDAHSFARDSFNCVGASCTKKCTDKYKADGDPWPCNKDGLNARIYPSCTSEARKRGLRFWDQYHSDGAFCGIYPHSQKIGDVGKCPSNYPNLNKALGLCYIDCEARYGKGWKNDGTQCWLPAELTGMGPMTCGPGEFKTGARCYKECPPGYTNMGESCHRNKQRVIDFSKR
jgi:hypothetical protein